jgi:DNA adenine methylase
MRYPGGKNHGSSYPRIINQIPPHELYIEPFAGSAAIRRLMRPSQKSILIDMDREALGRLAGWVPAGTDLLFENALNWLERDPLSVALPRMPTVIYCDPPYVASACASPLRYEHVLTNEDHRRLIRRLKQLKCFVLLSGYWSGLYGNLLSDWRMIHWPQITRGGTIAEECLWMNFPEPVELHDYRHLGLNFRERQDVKRQQQRWRRKLAGMTLLKRHALLSVLADLQPGSIGENAEPDRLGIFADTAGGSLCRGSTRASAKLPRSAEGLPRRKRL